MLSNHIEVIFERLVILECRTRGVPKCTSLHVYAYMYICIYICIYICYIYTYLYMLYKYVYIYEYIYVYIFKTIYVYINMYIYANTYIYLGAHPVRCLHELGSDVGDEVSVGGKCLCIHVHVHIPRRTPNALPAQSRR